MESIDCVTATGCGFGYSQFGITWHSQVSSCGDARNIAEPYTAFLLTCGLNKCGYAEMLFVLLFSWILIEFGVPEAWEGSVMHPGTYTDLPKQILIENKPATTHLDSFSLLFQSFY